MSACVCESRMHVCIWSNTAIDPNQSAVRKPRHEEVGEISTSENEKHIFQSAVNKSRDIMMKHFSLLFAALDVESLFFPCACLSLALARPARQTQAEYVDSIEYSDANAARDLYSFFSGVSFISLTYATQTDSESQKLNNIKSPHSTKVSVGNVLCVECEYVQFIQITYKRRSIFCLFACCGNENNSFW